MPYKNLWMILYHPYGILIIGDSGSQKTGSLFNLINHQPSINIFFYMLKILMKQNNNF